MIIFKSQINDQKNQLTDEGVDLVAVEKLLAIFDDVVVVLVVVAVVVQLPFLLVGRVLALGLLSSSFLFGIVNLRNKMGEQTERYLDNMK